MDGGSATRGVSHRYLLPVIGAHASDLEQPMLLYPKSANGTLKHLLLKSRDAHNKGLHVSFVFCLITSFFLQTVFYVTIQDLVLISEQISRGMYHLTRKGLVHKDLATRNI